MMKSDNTRFVPWLSLSGCAALVRKATGNDDNSAAAELVKAAEAISEASAKISEIVPTILNNKLGSSLANVQTARKAIEKLVSHALKRVDVAVNYARAGIDSLTNKTDPRPPADAMGATQHAEVRTALLRMSTAERNMAITTAISSGDETFLAAATSGSPTLSGMTVEQQKAARNKWRRERYADEASRIAYLQNGISQLTRIAPMLEKWAGTLIAEPSAQTIAAATESEAKAQAASN